MIARRLSVRRLGRRKPPQKLIEDRALPGWRYVADSHGQLMKLPSVAFPHPAVGFETELGDDAVYRGHFTIVFGEDGEDGEDGETPTQ